MWPPHRSAPDTCDRTSCSSPGRSGDGRSCCRTWSPPPGRWTRTRPWSTSGPKRTCGRTSRSWSGWSGGSRTPRCTPSGRLSSNGPHRPRPRRWQPRPWGRGICGHTCRSWRGRCARPCSQSSTACWAPGTHTAAWGADWSASAWAGRRSHAPGSTPHHSSHGPPDNSCGSAEQHAPLRSTTTVARRRRPHRSSPTRSSASADATDHPRPVPARTSPVARPQPRPHVPPS
jgi:hypothetical protein